MRACRFITLAPVLADTCRYSTRPLITIVSTEQLKILNYHFFYLILEISLYFCWASGGGGNIQRECKWHFSSGILHGTLCIWLRCKKVNNIPDILHSHLDNSTLKCRKVMLLTVSDQIIIIFLCKWVRALIFIFSGIYGFVQIVNTNVNMESSV